MVNEDSSSESSCSSDGRTSEKRALSEEKQRANTQSKKPKLMKKEMMNSNANGTKGKAVVVGSPSSKSKTNKDREIPMKDPKPSSKPTPTPDPKPSKPTPDKGKGKEKEQEQEIPPEDEESSEEESGDEESGEEEDQTLEQKQQQQKQGGQHQQQVDTDEAEAEEEEVKVVVRRSANNFKRTWTDQEEIFLLKLVENGRSPANADFIPTLEKSFQKKYSRKKVTDKLRRLKARYKKNRNKMIRNVPLSLSPHQTVLFNMSNNAWGAEETSQPQPQPPSLFKGMVETGVDARVMSWGLQGMTDHSRADLEGGWKKFCRRECNHVMKQSKFIQKVMASIIPLTREDEDASEG